MNENENYFRISRDGHIHTLSDRIPFKWRELLVFITTSFLFLIWFLGIVLGIFVAILTIIGYTFYRFASWIYYTELKIDTKTGKVTRLKKIFDNIQKTELITDKLDINRFEYRKLKRSGRTKFLLNYRTHKDNELLILRNKQDKKLIEKYIIEQIKD